MPDYCLLDRSEHFFLVQQRAVLGLPLPQQPIGLDRAQSVVVGAIQALDQADGFAGAPGTPRSP